jgi:transcriptional regulator with XRE-family HTH domain
MPTKANSDVIRQLREEKGLNCAQLAEAAGIDRILLWKIENKVLDGSPKTRLAIAEALDVPLAVITRFEPLKPRTKKAAAVETAA